MTVAIIIAIILEQSPTLNCIQMTRAFSGNVVLRRGKIGRTFAFTHVNNLVL